MFRFETRNFRQLTVSRRSSVGSTGRGEQAQFCRAWCADHCNGPRRAVLRLRASTILITSPACTKRVHHHTPRTTAEHKLAARRFLKRLFNFRDFAVVAPCGTWCCVRS